MIERQRIPLIEVRDIFIFPHLFMSVHLRTFLSVLPVYVHYMYVFLLSLLFGWYTVRIWIFVCVCCAAPDKLTSPPPFTGLGALRFCIRAVVSKPPAWGHALGLPEGRIRVFTPSTVIR